MKFFGTISQEVVGRLILCPPQHMRRGSTLELKTFAITSVDNMMPSKFKIRDCERPVSGEVYRIIFSRQKKKKFVDKNNLACECRDMLLVRVYPHDKEAVESQGELRFFTCPLTSEPNISPLPPFIKKIDGVKERGVWWIAAPDVDYNVLWTKPTDKILFNGSVLVQLDGLSKRNVQGAIKIDIRDRVAVYDRRNDHSSSFANAEYIQRTIGQNGSSHTFWFINLRDVSADDCKPEKILTVNGFEEA